MPPLPDPLPDPVPEPVAAEPVREVEPEPVAEAPVVGNKPTVKKVSSILDAQTIARPGAEAKRHADLWAIQAAGVRGRQGRDAAETARRQAELAAATAKKQEAAAPAAPAPTGTLHKPAGKPGAADKKPGVKKAAKSTWKDGAAKREFKVDLLNEWGTCNQVDNLRLHRPLRVRRASPRRS